MPSMDQAFSSKGGFSFLVAKTDPFVADGAVALCRFQPVSEMPVNIHFVSVRWVSGIRLSLGVVLTLC